MPRIVNHDERRAELAEAVWALIRERGLAGVTLRHLSEKSGWSSGAIRHYLPNREAILNFAAGQVSERVERRLRALPLTADPRQNVLRLLRALLPLDEDSRRWTEVWLAFLGAAMTDPALAEAQGILYRDLNTVFKEVFGELKGLGLLPQHTPAQAATAAQGLLDGLCLHVLLGYVTPQEAEDTLERLVGGWLLPVSAPGV